MARGRGQRPGGPPVEMLGQAADLTARRADGEAGPTQTLYINDLQPTVETDGTLTLTAAYHGSNGVSEAIALTMPMGLFAELVFIAPGLVAACAQRADTQAVKLAKVAHASGVDDEQSRRAIEGILEKAGQLPKGSVSELETHRG